MKKMSWIPPVAFVLVSLTLALLLPGCSDPAVEAGEFINAGNEILSTQSQSLDNLSAGLAGLGNDINNGEITSQAEFENKAA